MKNKKTTPIMGIIGYCFTSILLILSLNSYIPFTLVSTFDIRLKTMPLLYNLIDNGPLGEHGAMLITGFFLPILSMITTGIYHLILHKKYKAFPSKVAFIAWLFFPGFYIFTYASLFANAPWSDFLSEHIWYPYLTINIALVLIFNTVDFIRLIKLSKQETTN